MGGESITKTNYYYYWSIYVYSKQKTTEAISN